MGIAFGRSSYSDPSEDFHHAEREAIRRLDKSGGRRAIIAKLRQIEVPNVAVVFKSEHQAGMAIRRLQKALAEFWAGPAAVDLQLYERGK